MIDLTTTASPLLAAVAERRQQREQDRTEHERRKLAAAQRTAEKRRAAWIAELWRVESAVIALGLLGLTPDDAEINPNPNPATPVVVYYGQSPLGADAYLDAVIVLTERDAYMNVHFACEPWDWSAVVSGITVHELHDTIVGAAEALLLHVDARCGFEPEPQGA